MTFDIFLPGNSSQLLFPHCWSLVWMLSSNTWRDTLCENKKRLSRKSFISEMGGSLFGNSQRQGVISRTSSILDIVTFLNPALSQLSMELQYVQKILKLLGKKLSLVTLLKARLKEILEIYCAKIAQLKKVFFKKKYKKALSGNLPYLRLTY